MLGRGLMTGAQLPAAGDRAAEAALPSPGAPRVSYLDGFYPDAERLDHAGACCRRLVSAIALGGRPGRQGYACPAERFGGPPSPADLARLTGDMRWAEVDPARVLYLDTETTGLSHAAGTYVFLIGLGRFTPTGFIVEQYLMEDFADEPALVEAVDGALAEAQALVTYNGGCFDLPLLESRWRMQRRPPRRPALHLDLLGPARRLWRGRLPDCSLGTVERHILGHDRASDVPGMLIPRIYFDFVQGIRPERLVPVLDHHAQDIFSLGALAALFCHALRAPDDPLFAHPSDQAGLWRLHWAAGRVEEALARLEAAALAARDEALGWQLAMRLARLYRRLGRGGEALAIWHARAPMCRPGRIDPLIELAKFHEHVTRDPAAALEFTERALRLIDQRAELAAWGGAAALMAEACETERAALLHRRARLERKAAGGARGRANARGTTGGKMAEGEA